MTPLEVMILVMRMHVEAKQYDAAANVAKDAAPYMHARLSTTKVEIKRPEEMSDDELAAALLAAETIASRDGDDVGGETSPGASPTRH